MPESPQAERQPESEEDRARAEALLVKNLRARRTELIALLDACSSQWGYEDHIYRFYHQSFKVFALQDETIRIVALLQSLLEGRPLNAWFLALAGEGTGRVFRPEDNTQWLLVTRPIVEAFFHARFFLEMTVRYSDLEAPPSPLPSGYAALLYLYNLR